jgi:hypothetical protein
MTAFFGWRGFRGWRVESERLSGFTLPRIAENIFYDENLLEKNRGL